MWIDTHCHLDFEPLSNNIGNVLNQCEQNNIDSIIIPSVMPENLKKVVDLSKNHKDCFYALGFHPLFINKLDDKDLEVLTSHIELSNPIAIGEIGLDLYLRKDNINKQEYFFSKQLLLAEKFDLPVILHVRSAIDLILKHLRRSKVRGGVAHAFNGSFQQAEQFIQLGFKLGFGGAMTYPRAKHLKRLAKEISLEHIVLETDAPNMIPFWSKDKDYNQPAEIAGIGKYFSELRGMESLAIADKIRKNTLKVFPKLAELYT